MTFLHDAPAPYPRIRVNGTESVTAQKQTFGNRNWTELLWRNTVWIAPTQPCRPQWQTVNLLGNM